MRRYNVTEAPRAILTHELAEHVRREEHLNPDRPDRAGAYRRALQEIEMGAPVATARRTEFRVNEEMIRRYGVCEGAPEEIINELTRRHADDDGDLKRKFLTSAELREAMMALGKGAREVQVDRVRYRIIEEA